MKGTVESVNSKIMATFANTQRAVVGLVSIVGELRSLIENGAESTGKRREEALRILEGTAPEELKRNIEHIERDYQLSIVGVLNDYYASGEETGSKMFYKIVVGENFVVRINDIVKEVRGLIRAIYSVLGLRIIGRADTKRIDVQLASAVSKLKSVTVVDLEMTLEKRDYEMCKCGHRMNVVPELSELHCPNVTCGKIKMIIGAVFRDDQFYPQEGQKSKHGGYDTSRRYRFWIERIQGIENKTFEQGDIDKIEYVINRDKYDRRQLSCENIRTILKDPMVGLTSLNDHASLLAKTFGGPAPPRLNFQENKIISMRFSKAMKLYDTVVPTGGNKPYYPYFIYKISEYEFRDNPEKLRLLEYIHLQSRETVIKNDKIFEQMCLLAAEGDGLKYRPTVPGETIGHY